MIHDRSLYISRPIPHCIQSTPFSTSRYTMKTSLVTTSPARYCIILLIEHNAISCPFRTLRLHSHYRQLQSWRVIASFSKRKDYYADITTSTRQRRKKRRNGSPTRLTTTIRPKYL